MSYTNRIFFRFDRLAIPRSQSKVFKSATPSLRNEGTGLPFQYWDLVCLSNPDGFNKACPFHPAIPVPFTERGYPDQIQVLVKERQHVVYLVRVEARDRIELVRRGTIVPDLARFLGRVVLPRGRSHGKNDAEFPLDNHGSPLGIGRGPCRGLPRRQPWTNKSPVTAWSRVQLEVAPVSLGPTLRHDVSFPRHPRPTGESEKLITRPEVLFGRTPRQGVRKKGLWQAPAKTLGK